MNLNLSSSTSILPNAQNFWACERNQNIIILEKRKNKRGPNSRCPKSFVGPVSVRQTSALIALIRVPLLILTQIAHTFYKLILPSSAKHVCTRLIFFEIELHTYLHTYKYLVTRSFWKVSCLYIRLDKFCAEGLTNHV